MPRRVSLMEMRHLRYFVTLAEHASFRRAADQLGIAQPPLTRQIRALEREIGCRLVLRTSRGVVLTPAGRTFLDHARTTLAEAQRAIDQARVAAPEAAEHLTLACDATAEMAIGSRALTRLARAHPGMRVELHHVDAGATADALRRGVVQAAITTLPLERGAADLAVDVVGPVRLCIAVPAGHPFAGPRPVSWGRLAEMPLVFYARDAAPALHDAVTGLFQREGLAMKAHHHATGLQAALTLVAAGFGVTVVPSGWQPPRTLGLTCRPVGPPAVELAFGIAYRRDARTPAVARLVQAVRISTRSDASATARGRGRPTRAAS
jgi:DNA-binding transcriptional LysR family regulator